ncbi:MAG: hypothetical protein MUF75_01875 [Bacteroidia bacterium]|jgi:hypothetical protein|nr:hypothetical protein [Bacteroidia bacterium]
MDQYIDCLSFLGSPKWLGISAIATIIYTCVTYKLFKKTEESFSESAKISRFNVYLKIKESLNNDDSEEMAAACADNSLVISKEPQENTDDAKYFTKLEVRKKLIEPLEDLAKFEREGLIQFKDVDYAYGYYILNVGNNEAIVKLINEYRIAHNNSDVYDGFEELYKKIRGTLDEMDKSKYRKDFKLVES